MNLIGMFFRGAAPGEIGKRRRGPQGTTTFFVADIASTAFVAVVVVLVVVPSIPLTNS